MIKEIPLAKLDVHSYHPRRMKDVVFIYGLPIPSTEFMPGYDFNFQPILLDSGLIIFNMTNVYYPDVCQVQVDYDSQSNFTTHVYSCHLAPPEYQIPDYLAKQTALSLIPSFLEVTLNSYRTKGNIQ